MANNYVITMSTNTSVADMTDKLAVSSNKPHTACQKLIEYLRAAMSKTVADRLQTLRFQLGAVQATGTVVFTATQPVANETITINGVAFTAKASGATGNQYNFGAASAPGAIASATSLAAAINASATAGILGVVTADNAAGTLPTVTVTAVTPGIVGNSLVISESTTGTTAVSFASGAEGTDTTVTF